MRRFPQSWLLLACLAAIASAGDACTHATAATSPIDPNRLLAHIKFLASDELRGRANGSEGLEKAAGYIAAQFEMAGLRPGVGGEWFQPFELTAGLEVNEGNALNVDAPKGPVHLTLGDSYFPIAATPSDSPVVLDDVPLVFAGYGISAPEVNYDDYAGLDVDGKAVLIFSHEPQERRADSRLNGARPLRETTLYSKALAARTRGARALLVVSDPSHPVDQANYRAFLLESDAEDQGIPVLRVRRDDIAPLLRAGGLDRIAGTIDVDLIPRSHPLKGVTIDYTQRLTTRRRTVRNIVGLLPGAGGATDDRAMVLGGHYDHVGLGGRFSSSPERTGEIHNGADDNASGIAVLIETARNAAADRLRFPRTLVFVAFAGEERGLLGSAYYVSHPVIPLDDTVVMLNFDMVGRSHGQVEVGGLDTASPLEKDVKAAAQVAGVDAHKGGPGAGRSDDSNFLDKRVPALHFFTGFHDDYHRPSDDWERIDVAGAARVATLALELLARIAARDDRPQFTAR